MNPKMSLSQKTVHPNNGNFPINSNNAFNLFENIYTRLENIMNEKNPTTNWNSNLMKIVAPI